MKKIIQYSRTFATPKAHSNSSKKIQLQFNLIFNKNIIQYSKTFVGQVQMSRTKPIHPSSSRAFQRHQE
jgi:hypothetical protein